VLAIVGFVSQKGGVGKSTLARALATVAAAADIKVRLADLDPRQQTLKRWQERREQNDAEPPLDVASFGTVAEAIQACSGRGEVLIVDAPTGTSKTTLDIAKLADVIVQPTGAGIDDLDPAIILFHELVREGVPRERLAMALCRVATQGEETAARAYVGKAGYVVLPGCIPERAAYRDAHNRGRAVTETGDKVLNARTDGLLDGLLGMMTEKVKARMRAEKGGRKKRTAA
jgi:chromosome partitioning protein